MYLDHIHPQLLPDLLLPFCPLNSVSSLLLLFLTHLAQLVLLEERRTHHLTQL